jgi:hypothetical protein
MVNGGLFPYVLSERILMRRKRVVALKLIAIVEIQHHPASVSDSQSPDSPPDILTLVVTVEEIRMSIGPSEEHWRKASFMTWKELPETFEAAFGEGDIAAANAIRLRDLVRSMYQERKRLQKFEEPYTDYMIGETGIGKKVRRTITVAIRYHGDPQVSLPPGVPSATTIESGVTRRSQQSASRPFSAVPPLLNMFVGCLTGLAKRPSARL